jgi:hypothetical protein
MNIMEKYRLISAFGILLLIACMPCVQAIEQTMPTSSIYQNTLNSAIFGLDGNENQQVTQTDISQFSQYFTMQSSNEQKTHINAPKKQDIKDKTPSTIYFGYQMQAVPYTQYKNYATYTGGNSLWVQGASSWAQYVSVPQGASLSLLATASMDGNGILYEINPNGQLVKNAYYFYSGYNQIDFYADTIGQHILLFVINNQVSNAVVINVALYNPSYQQTGPIPGTSQIPGTIHPPTELPATSPVSTSGDTSVTINSNGMRGYQVFLDENYIGTEGAGGDQLDGRFSFRVVGNQYHNIRVYDGQFNYPKSIYFQRGVQKVINVEPGTAVYV